METILTGSTELRVFINEFYIRGSVHRNSRLKKSNKMQQYADIYLLLNYSTFFGRPSRPLLGVHKTVVAASGRDHTVWGASFLKRDQIRTSPYLVTSLFYVLLMMGAMDARNIYSNLAVNKYPPTVASRWISSTYLLIAYETGRQLLSKFRVISRN